jgi:RNA polymerase sigma-70 factor (ECF subfamily)
MSHHVEFVDDTLPTRWSLIARLKNPEDQDGWSTFAQIYGGLIRSVSLRTGLTEVESDEVLQNTLLSVHQNIQDFETDPSKGSFKGWLLHLTQWRIHDQFRKRSNHAHPHRNESSDQTSRTSTVERIPDPNCDLERIWEAEWKQNLLSLALEQVKLEVDPEHFQIFDFSALRLWPVTKVARFMQVNVGQVYLTRHRIGKLLKKKIERLSREMA